MDRNGNKKVPVIVRTRLPSNSSTSSCGTTRGTSTPTGTITKNRSFNFSPITNPTDNNGIKTSGQRMEPKVLKNLGPSLFPTKQPVRMKTAEEQATLLYMAYQQRHLLNTLVSDAKEEMLKESQRQAGLLLSLVKAREYEVEEMTKRIKLVSDHTQLNAAVNSLEPILKSTTDVLKNTVPLVEELAGSLDSIRHRIHLDGTIADASDDNDAAIESIGQLLSKSQDTCRQIHVEEIQDAVQLADSVAQLNIHTADNVRIMEECQQLSSMTISRLGQELTLADTINNDVDSQSDDFKTLQDFFNL